VLDATRFGVHSKSSSAARWRFVVAINVIALSRLFFKLTRHLAKLLGGR
jgi:hypothetical protein